MEETALMVSHDLTGLVFDGHCYMQWFIGKGREFVTIPHARS